MRRLIVLAVLAVAASLLFTGAASAQTSFQAKVTSTATRPAGPCSNGAWFCGTADIAGYGRANWDWYILGATFEPTPCTSTYLAATVFTLASDPSSTLVLDESGNLCGLGDDGAAWRAYFVQGPQAYGHPYAIVGNWTIVASTGQFSGLAGSGTDLVDVAGAHVGGSYSGAVG